MSKSLIPNPDKAQGVISEAVSQGKGALIGVATVVVVVPFLGWIGGAVAGAAVIGISAWRSRKR